MPRKISKRTLVKRAKDFIASCEHADWEYLGMALKTGRLSELGMCRVMKVRFGKRYKPRLNIWALRHIFGY